MLGSEPRSSKRAFDVDLGGFRITGKAATAAVPPEGRPIILAIHGGTYTCDYFDVPGYSLLDRAQRQGFDVIALDRPGYRGSTPLPDAPDLIRKNADHLTGALPGILRHLGAGQAPVFIIAHSIGAAIAITMAASRRPWTLAGLAISGVGATTPAESAEAYAHLPETYLVELSPEMKDAVMFGPPDSHPADMPRASHVAHTTVPRSELTDITGGWKDRVASLAAAIEVPVHYRQGEHEKLWLNGPDIVDRFGRLFSRSPRVDVAMVANAGHCIDFHHAGAAFQDGQLAFAARCPA